MMPGRSPRLAQLMADEVVVPERDLLQLHRDLQLPALDAQPIQHFRARLLQHGRPRVIVLVDTMPESHEPAVVLLVLGPVDERLRVAALGFDLLQHLDHLLIGAAVQRAPQRTDAGRDAGEQVGL